MINAIAQLAIKAKINPKPPVAIFNIIIPITPVV